jgi:L-lysine 2,3-aminomutase
MRPDVITWGNIDMSKTSNIKKLMHRYEDHVSESAGNPFLFIDHLGHELELHNDDGNSVQNISKALENIRKQPYYRYPIS